MDKIISFTVNHSALKKGLYVSRKDHFTGKTLTTFDMRFTLPNRESVMPTDAIHTIEHLGATFWRNDVFKDETVYFGPMGCRTGFYLVLANDYVPSDIYEETVKMLNFIIGYEGEIPGAKEDECGNYSDHNLPLAKEYCKKYLKALTEEKNFEYPA